MVTGCIALDGDARLREQCGGLGRQRPETFGADAGVRVFGSLPDRLGHRLRGSGHGRTVGSRQAAADDYTIEFHIVISYC